jgi:hypothetical protein
MEAIQQWQTLPQSEVLKSGSVPQPTICLPPRWWQNRPTFERF